MRSGDARYWWRGARLALNDRDAYVAPNTYGVQPHWSQVEGGRLHYLLTADSASRVAVIKTAIRYMGGFDRYLGDSTAVYNEGRIQARIGARPPRVGARGHGASAGRDVGAAHRPRSAQESRGAGDRRRVAEREHMPAFAE
jgi:hypothetical protein